MVLLNGPVKNALFCLMDRNQNGAAPRNGEGHKRHLAANVIFLLLLLTLFDPCSCSEHGHVNKYS